MSESGLEHYSKDQLIAELINRQTFAGIVVFHRGDAKAGELEPGEVVMTKSPPLTREGVENLLQLGASLVPNLFASTPGGAAACPALPVHYDPPPLRVDEGGVVRAGASRIGLDLIVEQYENGMTPEEIVRAYDSLAIADAYAVIAYYLRHRGEVLLYLEQRSDEADLLRKTVEAAAQPRISREELASRIAGEKVNAPAGQ